MSGIVTNTRNMAKDFEKFKNMEGVKKDELDNYDQWQLEAHGNVLKTNEDHSPNMEMDLPVNELPVDNTGRGNNYNPRTLGMEE